MRKTRGLRSFLIGVVFIALAGGCRNRGDVGKPCTLIRPDPTDTDATDGIRSTPVLESEINVTRDYVSFGATECDAELTCVRRVGTPITGDPQAVATGICSQACIPEGDIEEQCPTADGDFKAECRSLILDAETLAALCQNNPSACQSTVGDSRSSEFCVAAASQKK